MEKCIFLGYPPDYKGWKFYNPDTKRIIISERAVFDERYFPGLKNWSSVPLYRTVPPSPPLDVALNPPLEDDPLSTPMDLPLPHLEGEAPAPGHAAAPAPPVGQEPVQAEQRLWSPFLQLPHLLHQLHLLFLQHHPMVHIVLLNQLLHFILLLLLAPLILSLHALSLEFSPLSLIQTQVILRLDLHLLLDILCEIVVLPVNGRRFNLHLPMSLLLKPLLIQRMRLQALLTQMMMMMSMSLHTGYTQIIQKLYLAQ